MNKKEFKHVKTFEQYTEFADSEHVDERLFGTNWQKDYDALNKEDEAAVKAFHVKLLSDKITANSQAGRDSVKRLLNSNSLDITRRKKEIEIAKNNNWKIVVTPSGSDYVVKAEKNVKFGSEFKEGGTGGKTSMGGI
jgi:hypothetical protein